MIRKAKYLLIGLLVIVLTGCSGNYDLTINEDLSVTEEVKLTLDDEQDVYDKTVKIFEDNDIDPENYKVSLKDDEVNIYYKNKYNSIEDYVLNSKLYKQIFNEMQYNKTRKYVDLYVNENIKEKNDSTFINGTNLVDFDVIQVNVKTPFEVLVNNADLKNDDTYTWTIKKGESKKKIQFQFSPKVDKTSTKSIILIIVIIISAIILIAGVFRKFNERRLI